MSGLSGASFRYIRQLNIVAIGSFVRAEKRIVAGADSPVCPPDIFSTSLATSAVSIRNSMPCGIYSSEQTEAELRKCCEKRSPSTQKTVGISTSSIVSPKLESVSLRSISWNIEDSSLHSKLLKETIRSRDTGVLTPFGVI